MRLKVNVFKKWLKNLMYATYYGLEYAKTLSEKYVPRISEKIVKFTFKPNEIVEKAWEAYEKGFNPIEKVYNKKVRPEEAWNNFIQLLKIYWQFLRQIHL